MPLETTTTLAGLDASWPLGGDPTNKGDDHLRLIKNVLQAQFPGALGGGYDIPILATEAELNYLTGLTSNAQAQFDALSGRVDALEASLPAPQGTKLSFFQAAAPTGWTQDVANNDAMLRVVSGVGGGVGGTQGVANPSMTHTHVGGSHTLTESQIPSHDHSMNYHMGHEKEGGGTNDNNGFLALLNDTSVNNNYTNNGIVQNAGGGGSHSHGNTDNGTLTFTPKYVDMIIASKD